MFSTYLRLEMESAGIVIALGFDTWQFAEKYWSVSKQSKVRSVQEAYTKGGC